MPEEIPRTTWSYNLIDARADQEGNRLMVEPPFSYRLRGVDGQVKGGVRPSPGFQEVHRFDVTSFDPPASHDYTSVITDVFPVTFLAHTGYAYGFVYRVRRKNDGATCDVMIDWWNSIDKQWSKCDVVANDVALPRDLATDPNDGRQMNVAVAGKYIYVFIEGSEPILLYTTGTSLLSMTVTSDTGPNRRPTILSPDETTGLGSLVSIDVADRSATGQVVLLEYLPSEVPLGLSQADNEVRTLLAGSYGFAFRLRNSTTGRLSPLSEIAEARTTDFDPAAYLGATSGTGTGAGTGVTTGTGIASGTVDQPLFAAIEICYRTANYDQALIYRSVRTQSAGGMFLGKLMLLEKVIDLADYHTINNPGGGLRQAIYYYELDDIQLVNQEAFGEDDIYDEEMPRGGCAVWYDTCLVVSNLQGTPVSSSSDENRTVDPYVHLGEVRWSTLVEWGPELFPPFNRFIPSNPASDIIAMSIIGPHVLGMSTDRQFLIRKESTAMKVIEMHEGYGVVNDKALDSVGSVGYYVTSKGIKTTNADGKLDEVRIANKKIIEDWDKTHDSISLAYDPSANVVYVHNNSNDEMICLWLNTEKMTEEVDCNFRHVVRGFWPYPFEFDLADLENPSYLGFNNADYRNRLRETAMFLRNPTFQDDGSTKNPGSREPSIFVADYGRQRVIGSGSGSGSTEYTRFPVGGDSVFTIATVSNGGQDLGLASTVDPDNEQNGNMLYILQAADATLVGQKAEIVRATTTFIEIVDSQKTPFGSLAAGDIVGISPVAVQWEGAQVGATDEYGNPVVAVPHGHDFFVRKTISNMGAYFTNVQGYEAGNTWARYQVLAFEGASDTPAEIADVTNNAGTIVTSVVDGAGKYEGAFGAQTGYSGLHGRTGNAMGVGVRIICPNLDFRLTGAVVDGNIRADRHSERPDIGPS